MCRANTRSTLQLMRRALNDESKQLTAEDAAAASGVSTATAHRYLERMVGRGEASVMRETFAGKSVSYYEAVRSR
jgi:response regulator of citrate/malate metabolism